MTRYIALLRGVNVGGRSMLKMSELKAAFEDAGFENVVTYINSGNIAFDTHTVGEASIANRIEKLIEDRFGKTVPTMVRKRSAIKKILASDPFAGKYETHKQMHVLFMNGKMPEDKQTILLAEATDREMFAIDGTEIYALLLDGVADSLLGKSFIEKKLKLNVTGRNWRTVEKLAQL